jgi:DNA-binding transcriptional MocR family regulator
MNDDNSVTIVTQHLRGLIDRQAEGARLPSVRALMVRHHVGPATVQRAVARLVSEGLVDARPGAGTFVAPRRDASPEHDYGWQSTALGAGRASADALNELIAIHPSGVTSLSGGYLPAELQALPLLTPAVHRAVRRPGVWDRMPIEGLEPLRSWFARQIDGDLQAHDVLICPGTQGAIAAVFRALTAPGDAVLIESPTYVGAIAAAHAAGVTLVPVPTDAQGTHPDVLAKAFAESGARVFYCQPTYANPTGVTLSPERRQAVLDCVRAAGAFLIEDDWARDFGLDETAPPPLARTDRDGHVVYLRSLTKSAAPGLRIGAICARGAALARLRATRSLDDFFVAGTLQETALQLVTSPAWTRHLRATRAALVERRRTLLDAIATHLPTCSVPRAPRGGLHVWLRLPDGASDLDVAVRAARAGVIVSAGQLWFPAEPTAAFLRLSFVGKPADLAQGVRALAPIVR